MDHDDWLRVEHFYRTYDSEENIVKDTVMQKCLYYEENFDFVSCTFELGYIENYEELGLTDPWQERAAW